MAPLSPTVARWELTSRTRERTKELGISGAMVAAKLGFGATYWSKVDKDRKVLAEDKLKLLLELLELDEEEGNDLLRLRAAAKQRGWWSDYSALFSDEHLRLWGLEYGAAEISCFESLLIPGLLQTEKYARALIDQDTVNIPKREVDQRVKARMIRQERLSEPDPVHVNAVISQAALLQQIGGPAVLHEQLLHLAAAIRDHPDTLDIRIMPFTSPSGYILGGAAFYIMEFGRPKLPALGWHESAVVSGVIEDPDKVRDLTVTFEHAQRQSLNPAETLAVLEETAGRLGSSL